MTFVINVTLFIFIQNSYSVPYKLSVSVTPYFTVCSICGTLSPHSLFPSFLFTLFISSNLSLPLALPPCHIDFPIHWPVVCVLVCVCVSVFVESMT